MKVEGDLLCIAFVARYQNDDSLGMEMEGSAYYDRWRQTQEIYGKHLIGMIQETLFRLQHNSWAE